MDAFVDESCRTTGGVSWYVMAAVAVPPERADAARALLCAQVARRVPRFHWHSKGPARRAAMAGCVHDLDLPSVAVAERVDGRKSERARRHCLVRLLWEVTRCGVDRVVLESRAGRRDEDDRRVVAAAQRAGFVPAGLRYAFDRPGDETLLWLPDVVAGAVSLTLDDGDRRYLDVLRENIEVVVLP